MTLRFVIMEDMGARTRALYSLCKHHFGEADGAPFAALNTDDMLNAAYQIGDFGPEDLAEVDAVFVDFDLQTNKANGHLTWEPLTLHGGLVVPPVTGMSTLLYLRDLMETTAYQTARQARLDALRPNQRAWLGQDGRTQLFSYVEAKDAVSMLFAAAASAWFGATYFNAQFDLQNPLERDAALRVLLANPDARLLLDKQANWYMGEGAALLDQMLIEDDYHGKGNQLIPSELWPSNYDMFRIYLAHKGKSGFGLYQDPAGFRDAVCEVTGALLPPHKANKESTDRVFARVQASLDRFRGAADVNADEWADWTGLNRGDPMYDYLVESALFWKSADVRIAYQDHRRRLGATK